MWTLYVEGVWSAYEADPDGNLRISRIQERRRAKGINGRRGGAPMESKVSKHTRKADHPSTAHKSPLTSMTLLQGQGTSQLFAECNGPNQATKGSSQHATSPPSANIAMSMSKPKRDVHILRTSRHLRYTATHLYIWDYASADHAVEDLKNDPQRSRDDIGQGCKSYLV